METLFQGMAVHLNAYLNRTLLELATLTSITSPIAIWEMEFLRLI